jgi:hypothetical protein
MSIRRSLACAPAVGALLTALLAGAAHSSAPPAGDTAMTVQGRATLHGRVTLDGPAPDLTTANRDFAAARARGPDAAVCRKAPPEENEQLRWRIDREGGVGNVVVWLKPADGSHFVLTREDLRPKRRTWPDEVVIDQRLLNYHPHVAVFFPSYYDPAKKKQVPTGQVVKVRNNSGVACNVKWNGGPAVIGENRLVPAGGDDITLGGLAPDKLPIVLQDSIHPWMTAYAWVFDHPYAAVTDGGGYYEIKGVPAGVELRLMAWHEEVGYLHGRNGIAVELKDGDNLRNLRLRPDR